MAANWRQARLVEMVAAVDAGLVTALPVESPSDEEITSLAKLLLCSSLDLQAKGYTVESLAAEIRKAPPPNLNVGEDHMVHQGKVYRSRDFQRLPVSDGMFEAVRFFASESLTLCFGFFVARGFGPVEEEMRSALERIATLQPRDLHGRSGERSR